MTDRELLQQALDALNNYVGVVRSELNEHSWDTKIVDAGKPARETIEAIKARLAQPEPLLKKSKGALSHEENKKHNQMIIDRFNALQEQEPVAWWHDRGDVVDLNVSGHGTPLYFSPPKKELVGLKDEEVNDILKLSKNAYDAAKRIEAKLKEKNA